VATAFLLSFAPSSWAIHIPSSEIQVFESTHYGSKSAENTISDNLGNYDYWVGKDGLVLGDVNWLAYQIDNLYQLSQIDFYLLNTNEPYYFMGDLDIQVSKVQNPSPGSDGDWITFHEIGGGFQPGSPYLTVPVDNLTTSWIRLRMEYNGVGAWGPASPAFYLNEIDFYGTPVPEPATMLLLASGLVGLAGMRRKFKK